MYSRSSKSLVVCINTFVRAKSCARTPCFPLMMACVRLETPWGVHVMGGDNQQPFKFGHYDGRASERSMEVSAEIVAVYCQ